MTEREKVGTWRKDNAPADTPLEIRMPAPWGWWKATAKRRYFPEEEEAHFPNDYWTIVHYNGETLLGMFYGSPALEWRDVAALRSHAVEVTDEMRDAREYAARYCEVQADKWAKEATRPNPDRDKHDRDFRNEAIESERAFRKKADNFRLAALPYVREALANRKASAWQGFDFAPKDSRQILAWWKKDVWGVVYWSETEGNWLENDQIVGEAKFFRELDAPPRSLPSDGDGK